jgi:D-alanyl-D-alanine carboxypeptidase/D-alanyl-D-alanine-endopeptidase (penicillin-binding protein 4)
MIDSIARMPARCPDSPQDQHLAKGGAVTSRLRRVALLTLALLTVFTIGAGTAVAHLLPARLALWQIPRVAGHRLAAARPVLAAAGNPRGKAVTPGGLSARLSGTLGLPALGAHAAAVVADLSTGQVLFARDGSSPFAPASTAKLATAVAALDVLGPAARLSTRVVAGTASSSVILVGGGDPTLAAGRPPAADYPQPATLASLAAKTARALRARHRRSVRLGYDSARYAGPLLAPSWPLSYVTTGNVSPITSLEVDQGRLTASGVPQDADDPGNLRPRSLHPAADAAAAFGSLLTRHGIRVLGPVRPVAAPPGDVTIARVASPPLAEIVQWMLIESNNVIAENLARQVAIATRMPASFSGAAAAVTATDRRLGVRGIHLVDGSGLSPDDRITPRALVQLIALAARRDDSRLRPVITGLPIAGFAGTLAPGGSVFGAAGPPALGLVRAKTGNLNNVAALAGVAYASNGQLLGFAFMADRIPKNGLIQAGAVIDELATELASCGCR